MTVELSVEDFLCLSSMESFLYGLSQLTALAVKVELSVEDFSFLSSRGSEYAYCRSDARLGRSLAVGHCPGHGQLGLS